MQAVPPSCASPYTNVRIGMKRSMSVIARTLDVSGGALEASFSMMEVEKYCSRFVSKAKSTLLTSFFISFELKLSFENFLYIILNLAF